MSKALYVKFREQGFWVYDVVSSVFLTHLIDVVTDQSRPAEHWQSTAVEQWRANAVVSEFGFFLDDGWSTDQVEAIKGWIMATNEILSRRDKIPADELQSVPIVDGLPVDLRGMLHVPTLPVIRFGQALIQLLDSNLSEPLPDTWWFIGAEE